MIKNKLLKLKLISLLVLGSSLISMDQTQDFKIIYQDDDVTYFLYPNGDIVKTFTDPQKKSQLIKKNSSSPIELQDKGYDG